MSMKVLGLAKNVSEKTTVNNKQYLMLDIVLLKNTDYVDSIDKLNELVNTALIKETIPCKQWDFDNKKHLLPIDGCLFIFDGKLGEYKNALQFTISEIKEITEQKEDYINLFLDYDENPFNNIDVLKDKLNSLISMLGTNDAKQLWGNFVKSKYYEMYLKHPGAVMMHHHYLNGLLQHSLEVAIISLKSFEAIESITKENYFTLDKSLLIIGSLLHDIGKVMEIGGILGFSNEKTDEGEVMGHINSGIYILQELFSSSEYQYTKEFKLKLFNIIISHHGSAEFGSSVESRSLEAVIVESADFISSRVGANLDEKQGSDLVENRYHTIKLYKFTN